MEKEFTIIKDYLNHKKGDKVMLTEELEKIFKKLGLIGKVKNNEFISSK